MGAMSTSVAEHRADAPGSLALGVLTVSDTRTTANDSSGDLIVALAEGAGHRIAERAIVRDEPGEIRARVLEWSAREEVHAILLTGGTGIAPRDRTYETIVGLLTTVIPGYGELFRMLSFAEIG